MGVEVNDLRRGSPLPVSRTPALTVSYVNQLPDVERRSLLVSEPPSYSFPVNNLICGDKISMMISPASDPHTNITN